MEKALARLERRFGFLAIPNLTSFIVGGMAIVWVLGSLRPDFYDVLQLDLGRVRHGEVWRLITYLFLPDTTSPIWVLLTLYMVWLVGSSLEQEWGSFKFNLYYFLGMVGTTTAAALSGHAIGNEWLNWSLFFAFATLFPDVEFLLFFILPMKVKWLALGVASYAAFEFAIGSMSARAAIGASVLNYLLFFGTTLVAMLRSRNLQVRQTARRAESRPPPPILSEGKQCAICKAREDDGADIRVCTCEKCGGKPRLLCLAHARNH